jgi:hypothetical protein
MIKCGLRIELAPSQHANVHVRPNIAPNRLTDESIFLCQQENYFSSMNDQIEMHY